RPGSSATRPNSAAGRPAGGCVPCCAGCVPGRRHRGDAPAGAARSPVRLPASCHAGLVSDGASRAATPGGTGPRDPGVPARRSEPGLRSDEPVWWSDGHSDPWRDPSSPTQIVVPAPGASQAYPPLEPVADPDPADRPALVRVLPAVVITAVLVGVLAGVVGGALGYTYGARDRPSTALGADPSSAPPAVAARPPDTLVGGVGPGLPGVVT